MQKLTDYVMAADAAEILGVSQDTLRGWARDGKIPMHQKSGQRLPVVPARRSAGFSQPD